MMLIANPTGVMLGQGPMGRRQRNVFRATIVMRQQLTDSDLMPGLFRLVTPPYFFFPNAR
jgi:hypothetical protein